MFFILLDFSRRLVLIGGTNYAGEIKKSIFYCYELFAPVARCDDDALLGKMLAMRVIRLSFLGCLGLGRQLCHPTRNDNFSVMMSMAGAKMVSSISKAVAMRR